MLVWLEGERTLLGYEDPHELARCFSLAGVEQTLAQMATLLQSLAVEATGNAGQAANDAAS